MTQPVGTLAETQDKALKVLRLSEELEEITKKSKAISTAFNGEKKRIRKEIQDVLNDEQTEGEILKDIQDVHDIGQD